MYFSFDAKRLKKRLHEIAAGILHDRAINDGSTDAESLASFNNMLAAMEQAIEVMQRADADNGEQQEVTGRYIGGLTVEDINQIGGYALDLLASMIAHIQNSTGEQSAELVDISVPVSLWIARHGGRLSSIDMVVNSLAAYANETTDTQKLAELSVVIREVIDACDGEIQRDLEQSNRMRPWRILNLNYGIVATRSLQPDIMEQAYDTLVKNLPQDARSFFKEGSQQMDIVGYPEDVREVVERYNKMWGSDSRLH